MEYICETVPWNPTVAGETYNAPIMLIRPLETSHVRILASIGIGATDESAKKTLELLRRNDVAIALWPFASLPADNTHLIYLCEEAPLVVINHLRTSGARVKGAVGHSQGANVLALFAHAHPEQIEKLGLISPTLTPVEWSKPRAALRILAGLILNSLQFSLERNPEDIRAAKEAKKYMLRDFRTKTGFLRNRLFDSFMDALDGSITSKIVEILKNQKPKIALFTGKRDMVASPGLLAKSLHVKSDQVRILADGHLSYSSARGVKQLNTVIDELEQL